MANCEPAAFGFLEEEKLDIYHRSALKLNKCRFLTSFQPAEIDIMEVIKQILFPSVIDNESLQLYSVAELYKLNVHNRIHSSVKSEIQFPPILGTHRERNLIY